MKLDFDEKQAQIIRSGGMIMKDEFFEQMQEGYKAETDPVKKKLEKKVQRAIALVQWINAYHFKTVEESDEIYYYKNGVYLNSGEVLIKKLAQSEFKSACTTNLVKEMLAAIRRSTYIPLAEFNAQNYLNVSNGLIDLDTLEIVPHNPDVISTIQMPFPYNMEADCPEFKKFVSEVADPDDQKFLVQMFGWLIHKDYHIHKALMLVGNGRNGKGTYLHVVEQFIGEENTSAVTLSQLASDRYAASDLFGKAVNIGGDLPSKDISDTSAFKSLTGGDLVRAQGKYAKAFTFHNKAKMLFAANQLPRTADETRGFYSRWFLIVFNKTFEGAADDKDLKAKLTTQEELSGILNLAIAKLRELKANKWTFAYNKTVEDVELMYQRLSNPVVAFLIDKCAPDAGSMIPRSELQAHFNKYAEETHIPPLSTKKFMAMLRDQTEIPVSEHRPLNGERCWLGVRLREETILCKKMHSVNMTWSNAGQTA